MPFGLGPAGWVLVYAGYPYRSWFWWGGWRGGRWCRWVWGPLGPISKEQEIAMLREEAKLLKEELEFVNARLAELEGRGKEE